MTCLTVIIQFCALLLSTGADIKCNNETPVICYIKKQSIPSTESFLITKVNGTTAAVVIITDGQMPMMPNTIFTNNPQISTVSITSMNLQQIKPENFANADNLRTIIMMLGEIRSLVNGTFRSCGNLQQLQISKHKISFIDVNAFQGLKNLQSLMLENNILTSLHPQTFDPLTSLIVVYISNNFISSLDSNLFAMNSALKAVSFENNSITELPAGLFNSQQFKIESIDFSFNRLNTAQSYGAYMVNMKSNRLKNFRLVSGESTVHLQNNFIRKIFCPNSSVTVKRLYVANNLLSNFLCIRDMTNLTDLDVSDNKFLVRPTQKTFQKLTKLRMLTMCNMTKFSSIPTKAFVPIKNSLSNLRVDRLDSLKRVKELLPQIDVLGFNLQGTNCTYVQSLRELLKPQDISMNYCDSNRCP